MFISFDILFMVNSNQSNGAEVAANCILCIYLLLTSAHNCACGEGGTSFALTTKFNNFYIILKIFLTLPLYGLEPISFLALTLLCPAELEMHQIWAIKKPQAGIPGCGLIQLSAWVRLFG